jgi:sodium/bile acid cotransporter 7
MSALSALLSLTALRRLLYQQLLLLVLVSGVVLGIVWPAPGVALSAKVQGVDPLSFAAVCVIFFLTGLKLSTDAIKSGVREVLGNLWGLFAILFLTVVVGMKITQQITIPDVRAFGTGLGVFFGMPTTLTSGVVMTQQAGGHYGVALLLCSISNTVGIFTIPPMMQWLGDFGGGGVHFNIVDMIAKLILSLFVPLLLGKLLEHFVPPVRHFCKSHSELLKIISIFALAIAPWLRVRVCLCV